MAKKNKGENTEVQAEGTEAAPAARGRKIVLTNVETGESGNRVDIIKALWNNGEGTDEVKGMLAERQASSVRGAITKILKNKYNHEVPYQIVFAALKPAKPKKEKVVEAAADEAPAADEAA